jgi:Fe-S cluster assembly protein SufD
MNQLLENHFRQVLAQDRLFARERTQAWEQFCSLGGEEKIEMHEEASRSEPLPIISGCEKSFLILQEGKWNEAKSCREAIPDSVIIVPFSQAVKNYEFLVAKSFERSDRASLLNHALFEDGLFIYVPPGEGRCPPIQIIHMTFLREVGAVKNVIFCGKGSRVRLLEMYSRGALWYNVSTNIEVAEEAHCSFVEAGRTSGTLFSHRTVDVGARGSYEEVLRGGGRAEQVEISLSGQEASASSFGLWDLHGTIESSFVSLITHHAPQTRSEVRLKSLLRDSSKLHIEARAICAPASSGAIAAQKIDNLLLSSSARYDVEPILEILHDDVKASHGATSGKIEEEALLYFMMRGFSQEEARAALGKAFCQEIILKTPYEIPHGFA